MSPEIATSLNATPYGRSTSSATMASAGTTM